MSKLTQTTARLVSAYDRLLATYQVNGAADFAAYCATFDVDYEAAMSIARDDVARYLGTVRQARVTMDDFQ
jgi:hypothetical protein